jgi:hypothetical protein
MEIKTSVAIGIVSFLFGISLALQILYGSWNGDAKEQIMANIFENWQSEFLQLGIQFYLINIMKNEKKKEKMLEEIKQEIKDLTLERLRNDKT